MTTGNLAGAESNVVEMSYGVEAQWGVKPAVAFRAIRITGESMKINETRSRPTEMNNTGQVSAGITQQVGAGGGINFAFSCGTFDDLMASVLGGAWANDHLTAGALFTSLYLQKKLGTGLYFEYPGSLITEASLTFNQGQYSSGSFTVASKTQIDGVVDASTGAIVAAPGGDVIDTVGGFKSLLWNGAAPASKLKNLSLSLKRQGADSDFAVGSSEAIGQRLGLLEASGQAEFFFNTFDLYQDFKSKAKYPFSFTVGDTAGSTYTVTLPQAVLVNPSITAGGPNQAVMASFTVEGNPNSAGTNTITIDRVVAV